MLTAEQFRDLLTPEQRENARVNLTKYNLVNECDNPTDFFEITALGVSGL